jgi:TetR/AcrR family transcriptional regulator, mexJK operon transcriptional repressor
MPVHAGSRSAGKHEAIVAAATTVFINKGYLGTSMDEVAATARVSKQTVYKHFADKEQLFAEIVIATTGRVDQIVGLVADGLSRTKDVAKDLGVLAETLIAALMEPELLRLRRLVIANADRFPELGRRWYEQGFERVLTTLASSFKHLADRGLLHVDDPLVAANHFVAMLLWIPVNRAMFGGSDHHVSKAGLNRHAAATVRAFLAAYGGRSTKRE